MKRNMTITYASAGRRSPYYADEKKPMLRLTNRFMLHSGFRIGTKVAVTYESGKVLIDLLPPQEPMQGAWVSAL